MKITGISDRFCQNNRVTKGLRSGAKEADLLPKPEGKTSVQRNIRNQTKKAERREKCKKDIKWKTTGGFGNIVAFGNTFGNRKSQAGKGSYSIVTIVTIVTIVYTMKICSQ